MNRARWCGALALVVVLAGCTDRVLVDPERSPSDADSGDVDLTSEGAETSRPPANDTNGIAMRPVGAGAFYSVCEAGNQCGGLDYCVSPQGEPGFCTEPCRSEGDASECPDIPHAEHLTRCLDLHTMAAFCAISCEDDDCPVGMRCEVVAGTSGAARVCF